MLQFWENILAHTEYFLRNLTTEAPNAIEFRLVLLVLSGIAAGLLLKLTRGNNFRRFFFRWIVPGFLVTALTVSLFYIPLWAWPGPAVALFGVFSFYQWLWEINPVVMKFGGWFNGLSWTMTQFCCHHGIFGETGSGKTVIFTNIIRQLYRRVPNFGGMIIEDKGDFHHTARVIDEINKKDDDTKLRTLVVNPKYGDRNFKPKDKCNILKCNGNMPWENWGSIITDVGKSFQPPDGSYFPEQAYVVIVKGLYFLEKFMLYKKYFKAALENKIRLGNQDEHGRVLKDILNTIPEKMALDSLYEILVNIEGFGSMIDEFKTWMIASKQEDSDRETMKHIADIKEQYLDVVKETRDGIKGTIQNYLQVFAIKDINDVFCAEDGDFSIREMNDGKIICTSIPQHYEKAKRYINTYFKLLFFDFAKSRFSDEKAVRKKHNLCVLFGDESQDIVTASKYGQADHETAAKIRSAKCAIVYSCQDFKSYVPRLGKDNADVLILNLANKYLFRVCDSDSADKISKMFGTVKKWEITHAKKGGSRRKVDKPRFETNEIQNMPNHTCIIRHVNGENRKYFIPPIDEKGNRPAWYFWNILAGN